MSDEFVYCPRCGAMMAKPTCGHEKIIGYYKEALLVGQEIIDKLREAIETEWYNGNMTEDARDRLLEEE